MQEEEQEDKGKIKLNVNQQRFCEYFATEKEFFGNGVQSYIEAYGINVSKKGAYATARVSAHHLLTNPNVLHYINEIMEVAVLNDTFVDKELAFLISQDADFGSKIGAIKEYNKIKSRITDKVQVSGEVNISVITWVGEKKEND